MQSSSLQSLPRTNVVQTAGLPMRPGSKQAMVRELRALFDAATWPLVAALCVWWRQTTAVCFACHSGRYMLWAVTILGYLHAQSLPQVKGPATFAGNEPYDTRLHVCLWLQGLAVVL